MKKLLVLFSIVSFVLLSCDKNENESLSQLEQFRQSLMQQSIIPNHILQKSESLILQEHSFELSQVYQVLENFYDNYFSTLEMEIICSPECSDIETRKEHINDTYYLLAQISYGNQPMIENQTCSEYLNTYGLLSLAPTKIKKAYM